MNNEAADETQVDALLDESSDGVDMSGTVTVLDSKHVYQGAIFGVDDMRIALPMRGGGRTVIRRQVPDRTRISYRLRCFRLRSAGRTHRRGRGR